ncbi:MAG: hypothetical protein QF491_03275 [Alphaproteobacteria bacterium]|jgi:hypothetical protein|nr:hypothetical protein [Alphaproteobacteria bacterium]|tara:strand:+ start:390 stop:572 length:183 start_codon:yes stop_codon:yes gene_type:complete
MEPIPLPFGKQVEMFEVPFGDEATLLRLRIREGNRFTTVDLDPETARLWGARLLEWGASG